MTDLAISKRRTSTQYSGEPRAWTPCAPRSTRADEARSDAAHQARAARVAEAAQTAATDHLAAADAWDALATPRGDTGDDCRRGAALADRTRRRWATNR